MVKYKKFIFLIIGGFLVMLLAGFSHYDTVRPSTGFWAMEGEVFMHLAPVDPADSLSGRELYELRDDKGLTVWFGRDIFKDVCMTGQCKMMRLWVFWDGAGNYLGFQVPENEPLTKSDHTEFAGTDYEKLHNILLDTASILKDLKTEDLTVEDETKKKVEVDGYTAATKPGLAEVVVKDAVYTCHTLWHTVYGPSRKAILDILESRINEEYLARLTGSGRVNLQSAVVSYVGKYPEYHEKFYPFIMDFIRSEDTALSEKALAYFRTELLIDSEVQSRLAAILPELSAQKKYDIIWKFVEVKQVEKDVVLNLLEYFEDGSVGVGSLNLVFRLVDPAYLADERVSGILNRLSHHENAYVRNLTGRLLGSRN